MALSRHEETLLPSDRTISRLVNEFKAMVLHFSERLLVAIFAVFHAIQASRDRLIQVSAPLDVANEEYDEIGSTTRHPSTNSSPTTSRGRSISPKKLDINSNASDSSSEQHKTPAVMPAAVISGASYPGGIKAYYQAKIEAAELTINERTQNLRRLEAQRNALNARVRLLREELQLLMEPGSYVGEVVKAMGKTKVLVKVQPEGKYIVDLDPEIDINKLTPNLRVALRSDNYLLHKILPNKVDPLVSLMMVEKVPDSTYEMVGGLDKQIKEIKEVIELPVKHPELFEALGIAQPKGVLLYGPPGTGKTLLARAVAHHTDCRFIRVSGSELVQKYIGEGSRMVRELFVMAREHAPSIIFMDEIDSIGSSRGEGGGSNGDSEVQRTMLELLNQLDGFEATKNIKVACAVYGRIT
ncbi:26S proteasome regulatory subunit 8 [Serendipita sp. 411]|nr:26S proteasome regulatory subunit 8 [Serendipita sp. 397]KAG8859145.1 26S proteasome regulatory subunit 8 [Serendipita sp. 411]KAG9057077.1 26S proteasome regulatory subunit 8 [Serendipita sp. 407]